MPKWGWRPVSGFTATTESAAPNEKLGCSLSKRPRVSPSETSVAKSCSPSNEAASTPTALGVRVQHVGAPSPATVTAASGAAAPGMAGALPESFPRTTTATAFVSLAGYAMPTLAELPPVDARIGERGARRPARPQGDGEGGACGAPAAVANAVAGALGTGGPARPLPWLGARCAMLREVEATTEKSNGGRRSWPRPLRRSHASTMAAAEAALLLLTGWCSSRERREKVAGIAGAWRRVLSFGWRRHRSSDPSPGDFGPRRDGRGCRASSWQPAASRRWSPAPPRAPDRSRSSCGGTWASTCRSSLTD